MTILGKKIRKKRIINPTTGKTVIVPMDHGVTVGPIPGIADLNKAVERVDQGGADAVVVHKGSAERALYNSGRCGAGLIIQLSASTRLSPKPNPKTVVCSVTEAIKLGADGVSIHVNLGNGNEREMLKDFGMISREAKNWGVPLLAMIYSRGRKIRNECDSENIRHAARVASELGADLVKVSYTGSTESFRTVVEGCGIPVVIAGGEKMDSDLEMLKMVKSAMDAGGAGVSIGRNVFQHLNPKRMIMAISGIVHGGISVGEALQVIHGHPGEVSVA